MSNEIRIKKLEDAVRGIKSFVGDEVVMPSVVRTAISTIEQEVRELNKIKVEKTFTMQEIKDAIEDLDDERLADKKGVELKSTFKLGFDTFTISWVAANQNYIIHKNGKYCLGCECENTLDACFIILNEYAVKGAK